MGLLKSFFSQCARPKGSLGHVMQSFIQTEIHRKKPTYATILGVR